MTKYVVTVLHNISEDMFWRYRPETSALYHAHDFTVEAKDVENAADIVWFLANTDSVEPGSTYADVTAYRKRRNRSLSVSDVLVIHTDAGELAGVLVVASVGFEALEFMPAYTQGDNDSEFSEAYQASQRFVGRR